MKIKNKSDFIFVAIFFIICQVIIYLIQNNLIINKSTNLKKISGTSIYRIINDKYSKKYEIGIQQTNKIQKWAGVCGTFNYYPTQLINKKLDFYVSGFFEEVEQIGILDKIILTQDICIKQLTIKQKNYYSSLVFWLMLSILILSGIIYKKYKKS